jgi:hypothetical protein
MSVFILHEDRNGAGSKTPLDVLSGSINDNKLPTMPISTLVAPRHGLQPPYRLHSDPGTRITRAVYNCMPIKRQLKAIPSVSGSVRRYTVGHYWSQYEPKSFA